MAQQEYDGGDWFEQNAPDQSYQDQPQQQEQDQQQQSYYDAPQQDYYQTQAQSPTQGNDGNPAPDPPQGPGEPNDPRDPYQNTQPSSGPSGDSSSGGGSSSSDRATRQAQADELNRRLGLSDPGNLESFLSGRNTWAGYLADQNSRATNYTGNRLLDSQGGNYFDNGTLTAQGIAALARAGLNPNGTRMASPATGGSSTFGLSGGGDGGGGSQNYGALFAGDGFGAAPEGFSESYSTLERPENLRQPYKAPVWSETFTPPAMDEVQNEGGYALGLKEGQNALERSAAARGSILSGGTQKATARFGTDYGATKYAESTGRLFDQYKQRYGQFQDAAGLDLGARNANENAFNTDSNNNLSQYLTRFNAYQTAIGNQRNAENDVWSRNQGLIDNSLRAAALARPY